MTDADFNRWKVEHSDLFRFADADLRMIDLWRSVFEMRSFSYAELKEASMFLAVNEPKRWRAEHLEFILARVAAVRGAAEAERRNAEMQLHAEDNCDLCRGCGLVFVPHPHCVTQGEWQWPFYDAAVSCRCWKGKRVAEQHDRLVQDAIEKRKTKTGSKTFIPRMLRTIDEYETRYPQWPALVKDKERRQQSAREAVEATERADLKSGPLVGKKKRRFEPVGIKKVVEQVMAQVADAPPDDLPPIDEPPPF